MRKYKLTTQAFISSIISIVLCSVMLIGTTFAWYTDGAKVNVEDISAGEFRKEPATEEPTTEKETITEPTTKTPAEESEVFFIVIEGDKYDSDSDVFIEGETVEARAVASLKAEINMLFLTGISADVDDVIVIEDDASAEIISFSNCDFTLPADGKIISINGDSDIQVVLFNVTVNGEKITKENYSQYLTGIKKVIFM